MQPRHRIPLLSLGVRGGTGAKQQHRILRPKRQRFGKERGCPVAVAIAEGLPARIVQFRHVGLGVE